MLLTAAVLAALVAAAPDPHPPAPWPHDGFDAMATRIDVTVPPGASLPDAVAAVREVFATVEAQMSEWRPGSPVAAVNAAAGGAPVAVPREVVELVGRALEVGALSGGAFDITWAALWGVWRFRGEGLAVPDADAIARGRALIDYRKVELDRDHLTLRLPTAGMKLGLGGIAKGYALDRAADRLAAMGLRDFLLSAGGQVLGRGRHGARPWSIGLRDPRGGRDDSFAAWPVGDQSVSTSGDYESYFVAGGVRYHHIIDPATGWPSRGARAASVRTADATLADGLSTALMVLGPERGLALVAELRRRGTLVDAVIVDDAGRIHTSEGLTDLRVLHAPAP